MQGILICDQCFLRKLISLTQANFYIVGMDRPNVNWNFYDMYYRKRDESGLAGLVNTGSCGLHVLHGAFKTGAKKTLWKISKIMMALFIMLHDTPARRADYRDVTGSDRFPLQFCKVCWLDDGPVSYIE